MSTVPFDTHAAVKRLTEAGMAEVQAEALIRAITDAQTGADLATRGDLSETRNAFTRDIETLRDSIMRDIETLRGDITRDIETLRGDITRDIEALRGDITRDIEALRATTKQDITNLENRLIKWMIALVAPVYALLIATLFT